MAGNRIVRGSSTQVRSFDEMFRTSPMYGEGYARVRQQEEITGSGYIPRADLGWIQSPTGVWYDPTLGTHFGASSTSVAVRTNLSRTSKTNKKGQLNCAALDAVIPIPYGRVRVPGLVANVFHFEGHWVCWIIWCEGELDSVVSMTLNDEPSSQAVVTTHYLGTAEGELDPTLVEVFADRSNGSVQYTETCPGLAYSVIQLSASKFSGAPAFHAVIKGRHVYDPRDVAQIYGTPSTYEWSDNPSLILADYIENVSGAGKTVDWTSVAACADLNDIVVGSGGSQEVSRTCNILIDREADISSWIETLRTAASVFLTENQGVVKLVPDVDSVPIATYSHNDGNIISLTNVQLRDPTSLPTVLEVTYTDTSQIPWQDQTTEPVERAGIVEGITPYRKSVVDMRWITRASQAHREAVERINKLWLRSVTFQLQVFDEGLSHEPGDLIYVTFPSEGFENLPVRILTATPTEIGWAFTCEKHDIGCYSTEVEEGPTTLTTNLPLPDAPPAVASVSVSEERYQQRSGLYSSRLRITWPIPEWPFLKSFRITVWAEGVRVLVADAPKDDDEFVTGTVHELVPHQIDVQVVSVVDALSTATSTTFTPQGKYLIPGVVPWVRGLEAGGVVHLWWGEADDIDIWRYEIRYGAVGGDWDTATVLDRIDGLTAIFSGLPAGNWVFYVSAIDSVRQYSPSATTVNVTITFDTESFLVSDHVFDDTGAGKTLTNMTEVVFRNGSRNYVTDFDDPIGYGHTNSDDSVGTFDDASGLIDLAFDTPHSGGGASPSDISELTTETWDIGSPISGLAAISFTYTVEAGSVTAYIESKELIGDEWTVTEGPAANVANCRYLRGRISSTGAFTVTGFPSASISAETKSESFTDLTSNAEGPTTITLVRQYIKAKAILPTLYLPDPPDARSWAVDNVQLGAGTNTFDMYIFDSAGNQVASDFSVLFQGI